MITVNGNEIEFVPDETVKDLLKRMNYVFPLVVVKIDGEVVPKVSFGSTIIPDDATVQVIHLISGG